MIDDTQQPGSPHTAVVHTYTRENPDGWMDAATSVAEKSGGICISDGLVKKRSEPSPLFSSVCAVILILYRKGHPDRKLLLLRSSPAT